MSHTLTIVLSDSELEKAAKLLAEVANRIDEGKSYDGLMRIARAVIEKCIEANPEYSREYTDALKKILDRFYEKDAKEKAWKTKDGREMTIEQMDNNHLLNSINYMKTKLAEHILFEHDDEKYKINKQMGSIVFEKHTEMVKKRIAVLSKEARKRGLIIS